MKTWCNLAGIKCPFDAHRKKGNNKAGCNMSEETCCLGFLSMKEFYHKKMEGNTIIKGPNYFENL